MITKPNQQLNDCRDFVDAGLCVIPLRLDGSKASTIPWKRYQDRLPTDAELDAWFASKVGVAVVCGAVSGGLEVLDFDTDADSVFPAWSAMVDSILCWLPVVETPSGGYHVYYRCRQVCGNQKIALSENGVLIESRGQGGYVATILNPPEVHANHYEYIQTAGPILPDVPTIKPEERKALWKAALSFDRSGILKSRQRKIESPTISRRREFSNRVESARRYVAKIEPAISGAGGHNQTYKVACVLMQKFELSQEDSLSILMEYNERCEPQWTERQLMHKIQSASKSASIR